MVQRRVRQHHARATACPARPPRRRGAPAGAGRGRSGARASAAAPPRRSAEVARASSGVGRHHARTACRRGACARAAARPPPRRSRRRPGGSRRAPSPRGSRRSRSSADGARLERQSSAAARRRGTRSARRGSAGRPGRRTRARQSAHIAKPAIVVFGRSYGTSRTIVKRGPQLRAVDERVAIAAVGRVEQLAQAVVAGRDVGGDRRARAAVARARRDRELGVAGRRERRRASPRRRAPAEARRPPARAANSSSAPAAPSTSITTPPPSLSTKPASPCERASRYTNGRKPTPCTTPPTSRRRRSTGVGTAGGASGVTRAPARAPPARRGRTAGGRRRLGLLDARDVLRRGQDDVVGEPFGGDSAAVVANQCDRAQPPPPGLDEGGDDAARVAARGQRQQHIAGPAVRDHLAGEDRIGADVVGDRGQDRRVGRQVERAA